MTKEEIKITELDNHIALSGDTALQLIIDYFHNYFPGFVLEEQYRNSFGHWGIKYALSSTTIFIYSDRGYLEVEFLKNNSQINLADYDKRINDIQGASHNNIMILLSAINTFISSQKQETGK